MRSRAQDPISDQSPFPIPGIESRSNPDTDSDPVSDLDFNQQSILLMFLVTQEWSATFLISNSPEKSELDWFSKIGDPQHLAAWEQV